MSGVRLVADDITGAVDSAAPFTRRLGPLPVVWNETALLGDETSFAADTETRDCARPAMLACWAPRLAEAAIAFKKIDSQLRGDIAAEIDVCRRAGGFASVVIAPAFPARQRVTRRGRQFARPSQAAAWRRLAPDLMRAFARLGHELRLVRHADELAGGPGGVVLCDAASDADLRRIVQAAADLPAPLLWCGSAGLAGVLAGPPRLCVELPPLAPLLMVVGTDHAATRAQLDLLERCRPGSVVVLDTVGLAAAGGEASIERTATASRLASQPVLVLTFDFPPGTPRARAGRMLTRALARVLSAMPRPGGLFSSGGDTTFRLLDVLGTHRLRVEAELLDGVPLSRLEGGQWNGLPLVTKSGAFGGPCTLMLLLDALLAPSAGQSLESVQRVWRTTASR